MQEEATGSVRGGRSIERAVIKHERRTHDQGPNVAKLSAPATPSPRVGFPGEGSQQELFGSGKRPPGVEAEDLRQVETLADRLLMEASCTRPPVSVNLVGLLSLGWPVTVKVLPLGPGEQGKHHFQGDTWTIRIKCAYRERSRRFLILQEGFHVALSSGRIPLESQRESAVEWLAYRFAVAALMPSAWVRDLWPKVKSVPALAGILQAPVPAMKLRLRELGLLEASRG